MHQPITIPKKCPFCHQPLEGEIRASFRDQEFKYLSETKRIGGNIYTWIHRPTGCSKPANLERIMPLPLSLHDRTYPQS